MFISPHSSWNFSDVLGGLQTLQEVLENRKNQDLGNEQFRHVKCKVRDLKAFGTLTDQQPQLELS